MLEVYRDDASAVSVGVGRGRCRIGGGVVTFNGGVLDLASYGDDVVYVWLVDSGGGVGSVGHASDGTGWPGGDHLKLAEVTVSGGAVGVDGILDRRSETVYAG